MALFSKNKIRETKMLSTFYQKFKPDDDGIARFSIFFIHPPGKDF